MIRMKVKLLKDILLSLIGVATVVILALLGLTVYWHILRKGTIETEWFSSLKMNNNGNPDFLGQLIVKTDANTDRNKTCGRLSTMLEAVVAHRIHKGYNSDNSPEYLNLNVTGFGCSVSQRPVSSVQLYKIASYAIPVPKKQTKVNWHYKQGTEVDIEALEEEGVIYIKQSGYYYVSSLLTFRAQNKTTNDTAKHFPDVMSHAVNVVHHKDRNEKVLLENVKYMCDLAFEHAEWSSNIGAAFHLNEHDRVYAATSHPYIIVTGHSNNYLSIQTIL